MHRTLHYLTSLAAAAALAVLAMPASSAPNGSQPVAASRHRIDMKTLRVLLLNRLNEHRREHHLRPLDVDDTAQATAQFQAEDMEARGHISHADSIGRSPLARFKAFGGKEGSHSTSFGENVGYEKIIDQGPVIVVQTDRVWEIMRALDDMMMAERPPDDGHRETILSPKYDAVGIGIATGPNGVYLAEDFVGRT